MHAQHKELFAIRELMYLIYNIIKTKAMKIIKYACLMIVIVLINCELFDIDNSQFWVINFLTGIYIGMDSINDES